MNEPRRHHSVRPVAGKPKGDGLWVCDGDGCTFMDGRSEAMRHVVQHQTTVRPRRD